MEMPCSIAWLLGLAAGCLVAGLELRRRRQRQLDRLRRQLPGELERLAAALAEGALNRQRIALALEASCAECRVRLAGAERELIEVAIALAREPSVDARELLTRLSDTLRRRLAIAEPLNDTPNDTPRVARWRAALPGLLPLLLAGCTLGWAPRATPWLFGSAAGLTLLIALALLYALGIFLLWRELGRPACNGRY